MHTGFTTMCKEVEAVQVMRFLNQLYSKYDALVSAACTHTLPVAAHMITSTVQRPLRYRRIAHLDLHLATWTCVCAGG